MGKAINAFIVIAIILVAFFLWRGGYLDEIISGDENPTPTPTPTPTSTPIPTIPTFTITPTKIFVKGLTASFSLTFTNNGNAEIKNVHFKLNDPDGVFASMVVTYSWKQSMSGGWAFPSYSYTRQNEDVENIYGVYATLFDTDTNYNGGNFNVLPQSSAVIHCGDDYWGSNPQVSDSIQAGTYHLSWSVQFEVTSGSFNSAPNLTIPWDVVIYG